MPARFPEVGANVTSVDWQGGEIFNWNFDAPVTVDGTGLATNLEVSADGATWVQPTSCAQAGSTGLVITVLTGNLHHTYWRSVPPVTGVLSSTPITAPASGSCVDDS